LCFERARRRLTEIDELEVDLVVAIALFFAGRRSGRARSFMQADGTDSVKRAVGDVSG
jgi:hypothetical protein